MLAHDPIDEFLIDRLLMGADDLGHSREQLRQITRDLLHRRIAVKRAQLLTEMGLDCVFRLGGMASCRQCWFSVMTQKWGELGR